MITIFYIFYRLLYTFLFHAFKKKVCGEYVLLRKKVSYHKHTHKRDGSSETAGCCCKGEDSRSLERGEMRWGLRRVAVVVMGRIQAILIQ